MRKIVPPAPECNAPTGVFAHYLLGLPRDGDLKLTSGPVRFFHVDEISMLSADFFARVDVALRKLARLLPSPKAMSY